MTMQAQPIQRPAGDGLRAFLAETLALYGRAMKRLVRRPVLLYFSLVQPIFWMLLFGQIFNRVTQLPGAAQAFGGRSYFQFFIPAVIMQTILFSSGQSGIAMINDIDSGFLDKLLITPISRMAILLGRILSDMTRMMLQSTIILLVAWLFGGLQEQPVEYVYGLPGLLGALALAVLFGLGLAGLTVSVALKTRHSETTFLVVQFITLPLLFTSSAQLPLVLLPEWLQQVARVNPVTYAIDSVRFLLNGPSSMALGKPGEVLLTTLLILGTIAGVSLTLAVKMFKRAVRS